MALKSDSSIIDKAESEAGDQSPQQSAPAKSKETTDSIERESNQDSSRTDQEKIDKADSKSISDFHAEKLRQRRMHWQMRWDIVGVTAAAFGILILALFGSYYYNSSKASATFLSRADAAAESSDFNKEVRWLSSYLLLNPEDVDAIVRTAVAADKSVENATRQDLRSRVDRARKRLGTALAYIDEENKTLADDLRNRLIKRILQSEAFYFSKVVEYLAEINPPIDDPDANRSLALSLAGQVRQGLYQSPSVDQFDPETEPWRWLGNQPPGVVVRRAVELNPDDLDLIGSFLALLESNADLFGGIVLDSNARSGSIDQASASLDEETERVLLDVLANLQLRTDSRAAILVYRYAQSSGDTAAAKRVISQGAELASKRLGDWLSSFDQDQESNNRDDLLQLTGEQTDRVWDYRCIYVASSLITQLAEVNQATTEEISQAEEYLQQLRSIENDAMPVGADLVKQTYLMSGLLAESRDERDRALELWKEGLTVVNDDNLDLLGSIGWLLSASPETEKDRSEAIAAIKDFEKVIKSKRSELIQMTADRLSSDQRTQLARRLDAAAWQAKIARARVAASREVSAELDQKIIDLVARLGNIDIDLPRSIRLAAVDLLVDAYSRRGEWDLAANTLSQAADLFPAEERLYLQAAEAWTRAGNRLQAQKEWRKARLSNIPQVRIAGLEADFAYQLRLKPEQRNMGRLRSGVATLKGLLESMDGDVSAELLQLQLLEARIAPDGVQVETYLQSEPFAKKMTKIADENVDNAALQIYAAERLAASGDVEDAERFVARVEALDQISELDRVRLRARVATAAGDHHEAATLLLDYAQKDPAAAKSIALMAAQAAARAGDNELAADAYASIPEKLRSPEIWYRTYKNAVARGEEQEAKETLKELHQVEGFRDGKPAAYSKFIEASELIKRLVARGKISRDDQELAKATRLVRDLQTVRPNWGNAVALEGWIAFARQNYESAIELLERGINAGDTQLSTRQMLWQSLIAVGRDEDAEREIRFASFATQSDIDPYDNYAIGFAVRRGDLDAAKQTAANIVKERPEDPIAHLGYAKVLMVLWAESNRRSAAGDQEEMQQLLESARSEIDLASQFAKTDEQKVAVASSRLQMAINQGPIDGVTEELERIQASDLQPADRLLLEAQAHVALKQIDQAIECLEEANRIRKDFRAQMLLVKLLRTRGRGKDGVEILQEAVERDPSNPRLKTELAAQIAASGGDQIDWKQIEELLNNSFNVTTENRYFYALLLASRGNEFQKRESIRLLRQIAKGNSEFRLDAERLQAMVMTSIALNSETIATKEKQDFLDEARATFSGLADRSPVALIDLTRYCSFLIQVNQEGDQQKVQELLARMQTIPDAVLDVLRIKMAMARAAGDSEQVPEIVEQWAGEQDIAGQFENEGGLETAAGDALMRAGFIDEGVNWFKKAYESNPKGFAAYTVALSMASRHAEAAKVAAGYFRETEEPAAAILLVEVLLAIQDPNVANSYQKLLDEAIAKYPDNVDLLDGVATFSLQKNEIDKSIALYQRVLTREPRRLRTLNNLAMVLAEIPGRELEALKPVEDAIKVAGENAELLDTKGTVLLRAGRVDEAMSVFARAMELSEEPRFRFHMIETMIEKNDIKAARTLWDQIDLERLDPKGLTEKERKTLEEIKVRFGSRSVSEVAL